MIAAIVIFILGLLFKAAPLLAQDVAPLTPAAPPAGQAAPLSPQPGEAAGMSDIHDIKPVLAVGADLTFWLWVAVGLMVLAAVILAWFFWKRRRRSKDEQPDAVKVAPDAQALNDLDALAAEGEPDGRTFYFRLSAVLRTYLEGRYAFAAAEMTTEELLPAVDRLGWPVEMSRAIRTFCNATDPIKFADAPASRDRMASDLAYVRQLVIETRVTEENSPDNNTGDADADNIGMITATPVSAASVPAAGQQHRLDDKPVKIPETREP